MRGPHSFRKQTSSQADWLALIDGIEAICPRAEVERLAARAVHRIRAEAKGKRVAFGWSGGKDSLVLAQLCAWAGVEPCVLALTHLEYPEFLRWVTAQMPPGLTVVNTGLDLDWLARHPEMLFPQDGATAGKWFRLVQHTGQERYYRAERLDRLFIGRRRADGNYCGPAGESVYESRGIVRSSPIASWSHAAVVAFNVYFDRPLPPCYDWPNGFRVGTGPWAARQYTGSIPNGWREVFTIDPTIVQAAATRIPSARAFLAGEAPSARGPATRG
jgi:hypothetical protein